MKWTILAVIAVGVLAGCGTTKEPERKAVPPQGSAGNMPWATPEPGTGGGALGGLLDPTQR
jgi:uncharacterized lipoprotein